MADALEIEWGIDGRLCSTVVMAGVVLCVVVGGVKVVVAVVADADRGPDRLFFTLENSEVTIAYEDWSFSSSSAKGLKDVRLVTSSSFELLRDLEDAALPNGGFGDIG